MTDTQITSCLLLQVYTPIDPNQEEKNRDIRSRYNGRLFLSWLQDVDDKWEKIKVLLHAIQPKNIVTSFVYSGTNGSEASQRSRVSECCPENGLGVEIVRN